MPGLSKDRARSLLLLVAKSVPAIAEVGVFLLEAILTQEQN